MTWEPTWEPEELKDTLPNLLECIHDFETRIEEPNFLLPTADKTFDNLERQGFDMSNKANTWIKKLDTDLRNKVTFDIHPTNPQVDIQPTGSCEFWIQNVDLVNTSLNLPMSSPLSAKTLHLLFSQKSTHQE